MPHHYPSHNGTSKEMKARREINDLHKEYCRLSYLAEVADWQSEYLNREQDLAWFRYEAARIYYRYPRVLSGFVPQPAEPVEDGDGYAEHIADFVSSTRF